MSDLPSLPTTLLPQPRSRLLTIPDTPDYPADLRNPNYAEDLFMLVLAGFVPSSGPPPWRTAVPRRRQQLMIKQWEKGGKLDRGTLREMWLICESKGGNELA